MTPRRRSARRRCGASHAARLALELPPSRSIALLVCVPLAFASCSLLGISRTPVLSLPIPPDFNRNVTVKRYNPGDFILNSPPYVIKAEAPMTEYHGWWGSTPQGASTDHAWNLQVSLASGAKILEAYAHAKDGYAANLNKDDYMFERFERKTFSWGKAVCYFSQSSQDGMYVPNNGHLDYQVWGATADGRHVINGFFAVTHPKLAPWGPTVRCVKDRKELEQDRDYRLVEHCPPSDFQPSLGEIDAFLDAIKVK